MKLTKEEMYKLGFILSKGARNGLEITDAERFGFYDFSFAASKKVEFRMFSGNPGVFALVSYLTEEECSGIADGWTKLREAVYATLEGKEVASDEQTE